MFEIILLVVIICYIVIKVKSKKQKKKDAALAELPLDSSANAIIEEAITVINDFLGIGYTTSILSDTYEGAILVNTVPNNLDGYRIKLTMYKSGDLMQALNKYPKTFANNPEMRDRTEAFLYKYKYCYDTTENSYIYQTRNTVRIKKGQEDKLKAKLLEQSQQQCSLAKVMGGIIYTVDVER